VTSITSENIADDALALCKSHLEEHPNSITAAYMLVCLAISLTESMKKTPEKACREIYRKSQMGCCGTAL
jgi:transcription elongation factor GreA-like protein